jgi:phosphatidylglycerophosphate synthase
VNQRNLLELVPNSLSASRIVLGLAFPLVPLQWRLWVAVLAAFTDGLDGLAARRLRLASDTGRLLDPIADKVCVLMLAGTLIAEGALHPLWAAGIAVRDLTVLAGGLLLALSGRWAAYHGMRPTWLGKATTAAQFAVLLAAVVWGGAALWLLAATTALSTATAAQYTAVFMMARTVADPLNARRARPGF